MRIFFFQEPVPKVKEAGYTYKSKLNRFNIYKRKSNKNLKSTNATIIDIDIWHRMKKNSFKYTKMRPKNL